MHLQSQSWSTRFGRVWEGSSSFRKHHACRRPTRYLTSFLLLFHIHHSFIHCLSRADDPCSGSSRPCEQELHFGWKACRLPRGASSAQGCDPPVSNDANASNELPPETVQVWNITSLPTTALAVLLENKQIMGIEDIRPDDVFFSNNLQRIPDIQETGRDFYTLVYQRHIDPIGSTTSSSCSNEKEVLEKQLNCRVDRDRQLLRFDGVNYSVRAWLNGQRLDGFFDDGKRHDGGSSNSHHDVPGMFRRRWFDVSPGGLFVIQIFPPYHPGTPCQFGGEELDRTTMDTTMESRIINGMDTARRRSNLSHRSSKLASSSSCQGGQDHALAKDGAVPQYMLGWDWCQAMPDRATGFYGSTVLEWIGSSHKPSTAFLLKDPAIQTIALRNCSTQKEGSGAVMSQMCNDILLRVLVDLRIVVTGKVEHVERNTYVSPFHLLLQITSDWGEKWHCKVQLDKVVQLERSQYRFSIREEILVKHPHQVNLWWPHGLAMIPVAHMHSFTLTLLDCGEECLNNESAVLDSVSVRAGIRTVTTRLDDKLQGQKFFVNNRFIYLFGGNWIGTDQMLRYSASRHRYCKEIFLHRAAGLNLIRIWGGATAERNQFYECTDQYGIFVYQEFWMTGDNNGRWAGNYSWPLDYSSYLKNAEDTILRLRHHPSLLLYVGCNECAAPRGNRWGPNPPAAIDQGIESLIQQYDPGRFYISSSMGGRNKADSFVDPVVANNRSYSLAYADGPYGMLMPSTYFQLNPGLSRGFPNIGFQPEVGSVGVPPSYEAFLRFMAPKEIEHGFPKPNQHHLSIGDIWKFHNFQPWTTENYDHVYAYFDKERWDSLNASDWIAAAQLAAVSQYQALCNGFISHVSEYTTAVIIWKTQSPWPSLRGHMYDWFELQPNGVYHGIRSALRNPISVVYEPPYHQDGKVSRGRLRLVNRQAYPLSTSSSTGSGALYRWIDIHGNLVANGQVLVTKTVPAMASVVLQNGDINWPNSCTRVCFLQVQTFGFERSTSSSQWFWLTDPELGEASDFSALGRLRDRQAASAEFTVDRCSQETTEGEGWLQLRLEVSISVFNDSPDVLFYPVFQARALDKTYFPLDSHDVDFALRPGEQQYRILTLIYGEKEHFQRATLTMTSWNAPVTELAFSCVEESSN